MIAGTNEESIGVHYEQLCDDNEATSNKVLHTEILKPEDIPEIRYF